MAIAVTSAVSATTAFSGLASRRVASSRDSTSLCATPLSRAFGLRTCHSRVTCSEDLKFFKVTFTEGQKKVEVLVDDDTSLMLAAKSKGLMRMIPKCGDSSCRDCTGRVTKHGGTEPWDDEIVDPPGGGLILLCRNYPKSDTEVEIQRP